MVMLLSGMTQAADVTPTPAPDFWSGVPDVLHLLTHYDQQLSGVPNLMDRNMPPDLRLPARSIFSGLGTALDSLSVCPLAEASRRTSTLLYEGLATGRQRPPDPGDDRWSDEQQQYIEDLPEHLDAMADEMEQDADLMQDDNSRSAADEWQQCAQQLQEAEALPEEPLAPKRQSYISALQCALIQGVGRVGQNYACLMHFPEARPYFVPPPPLPQSGRLMMGMDPMRGLQLIWRSSNRDR